MNSAAAIKDCSDCTDSETCIETFSSLVYTTQHPRYHQGKFEASRENYLEGFVSCTAYDKQVIVRGLKNLNRAVHEDVVAIEVFPKSQWVSNSVCYSGF